MVIQDRTFDTNGQWFFPTIGHQPRAPLLDPGVRGRHDRGQRQGLAVPERRTAKRYRFLFINGSNARAYEMFLTNPVTKVKGPPIWQIGTDGGYLDAPVKIDPNAPKGQLQRLLIMPGERSDVIIDFAGFAGQTLRAAQHRPHPYPERRTAERLHIGRVMQFRVGAGPRRRTPATTRRAASRCARR